MAQTPVRNNAPRRGVWSGSALILGAALGLAPAQAAPVDAGAPLPPNERAAMLQTLARACDPETPAEPAALDDAQLQREIVRFATAELGLRIRPPAANPLWSYAPPARRPGSELAAARAGGGVASWLASLSPADRRYGALIQARCRYRTILRGGGWPALPAGDRITEGSAGPEVMRLRSRLAAEGYLPAGGAPSPVYDAGLVAAVREFQRRHGLHADGVVGPRTISALNVSTADRLTQIEANLERWRWLPRPLAPYRVEVDVAGAEAALFAGGQRVLEMRAIVGDPRHQTPLFSSRMEAVVFNPVWVPPLSIVEAEIWPRVARDPGYLARNGFTETANGLQQAPGPKNPLGRIKFDFPSPFGVYLHDTNAPGLFARDVRTLSHGCVRLERPRALAAAILGTQGWTAETVDQEIATSASRRVALSAGPAISVLYTTAAADDGGPVAFTRDPYHWDAALTAALAARAKPLAAPRAGPQRTIELVSFAAQPAAALASPGAAPWRDAAVAAACDESAPQGPGSALSR